MIARHLQSRIEAVEGLFDEIQGDRKKNGVVVLPADVRLPEAAEVDVTPREVTGEGDPFLALVEKLAKPRPHWPPDYVINHGHYVSGEPRRPRTPFSLTRHSA